MSCSIPFITSIDVLVRTVVAIPPDGGGEINTLSRQTDQQKQDGMAYFLKGDEDRLNVTTKVSSTLITVLIIAAIIYLYLHLHRIDTQSD